MADVRAVKSGNWSDPTVWNTGALPTSADDVWANNFTVAADTTTTVLSIRNGSTTGVTAGGSFTAVNGVTLTLTGAGVVATGTVTCFTSNLTTGQSCTITGNVTAGTSGHGVNNNSTGTLNINGNVTGGTASPGAGARNGSTGTVNIAGNVTGGSTLNNDGARNDTTGVINITGTVTGGTNSACFGARNVLNANGGTLNITGNCIGGSGAEGVINQTSGLVNITGNCTGSSAYVGALNSSTGTMNITGTCTGNASAAIAGANNTSTGTMTVVGTVQATNVAPGIGGPNNVGQVTILTGPLVSSDASYAGATASGVNPCWAARWFPADTALSTFEYRMRGQTVAGSPSARPPRQLFLIDAYTAVSNFPSAANVRNGTAYGPGNIYTGTCAVPAAASVAFGVPVDNTTGTAVLTQANFQAALEAQGLTSTRAAKLDNLDTTVSSRLSTSGYTTPPTVTQIRTEMDSNSTKLANLDATVSSRSTYDGADTGGTTTLLSRLTATRAGYLDNLSAAAPSTADIATAVWSASTRTLTTTIASASDIASAVWSAVTRTLTSNAAPSAADVATAVRSELATELARLDAAISTRLAASGYTTPPTASAIATAVNSALDRTGYSLTSAERQAIATAVEQSILNENDGQAILNAIIGAIGNQNVDQIALVAAIRADLERNGGTLATRSTLTAGQVRTELSTELGRIDTTVSSRLAPGGTLARVTLTDTVTTLTNAPDVPTEAEIADAVRTELAPELARLSNVATTQEVGDIVEGALSA